jgi:hypothetical protein
MVLPLFQQPRGAQRIRGSRRRLVMNNTAKPISRITKLLKEMPWLYAVKAHWGTEDTIEMGTTASRQFLDWEIFSDRFAAEPKSCCFVRLESDFHEEVIKIELSGVHRTWFDALVELRRQNVSLDWVTHMATVVGEGDEVRVYRTQKDRPFAQMFDEYKPTK